jgi:hypothetical protein
VSEDNQILGRQLGTILGGGIMPVISASLLAVPGGALTWVLAYFVLICALAVGAVISARETAGVALPEQQPAQDIRLQG